MYSPRGPTQKSLLDQFQLPVPDLQLKIHTYSLLLPWKKHPSTYHRSTMASDIFFGEILPKRESRLGAATTPL